MPAIAALSLTNQAAAAVVFSPSTIDAAGVAKFFAPGSVLDGQPSVSASLRRPKNGSMVSRAQFKIVVPKMNSIDPSKKDSEAYVNIEFVFPKNSTSTERLDVSAFAKSLLAHASVTAMLTNVETFY